MWSRAVSPEDCRVDRTPAGCAAPAVAPTQLRPGSQEERNVRAQPRGERAQGFERKGTLERLVRKAQGGRGVGALFPSVIGFLSATMPLGRAIGIFAASAYALLFVAAVLLPETRGRELAAIA